MFKITKNPTFTHTVPVRVPVDGGFENESMKVKFKLLDDDVMATYNTSTMQGQKDFLDAAIVSISDLVDAENKPVDFNDKIKKQIIGLPYARNALLKGYTDGIVPGLLGN